MKSVANEVPDAQVKNVLCFNLKDIVRHANFGKEVSMKRVKEAFGNLVVARFKRKTNNH